MTNPRLAPPERDPPPGSRPLDLSADKAGAFHRETQFNWADGKGGPSQKKTDSSGMYHEHWRRIYPSSLEPNPLIGLSPPPVLKSATSVYPFFHAQTSGKPYPIQNESSMKQSLNNLRQ